MTQRTDVLLIASGEYSDYQNCGYKVCKPFTFDEAHAEFKATASGYLEEFTGWLVRNGYIELLEIHEVHIGSYGRLEISEELGSIQFKPAE